VKARAPKTSLSRRIQILCGARQGGVRHASFHERG
jgi:hypothetical protein